MARIDMFVFNSLATDARVKRSIQALKRNNSIMIYSYGKKENLGDNVTNETIGKENEKMNYLKFLLFVIKNIYFSKADVFYAHDYYSLPIVYLLIKFKRNKKIIYDAHELLIDDPKKKLSKREKFFLFFERRVINEVTTIAASEERSIIMKNEYQLKNQPLVVENISILVRSNKDYDRTILNNIENFKKRSNFLFGYTGALSIDRNIFKFVKDIVENSNDSIVIIGNGDQKKKIVELFGNHERVLLLDTVPYDELFDIVGNFDAGIIQYPSSDWNNKFCASNKIFEYVSRDKPFVFYSNPTLENLAEKYSFCIKVENTMEKLSDTIREKHSIIQKDIDIFLSKNSVENLNERIQKAVEENSI